MKHYLVQSDTGAQVRATITRNDTGLIEPLTGSIALKFRARGGTTLFTLQGTGTHLSEGIAVFIFGSNLIELTPGYYEGEIEVTHSTGDIESVYELIYFKVREDF
jgi:hypothetical protein